MTAVIARRVMQIETPSTSGPLLACSSGTDILTWKEEYKCEQALFEQMRRISSNMARNHVHRSARAMLAFILSFQLIEKNAASDQNGAAEVRN